MMFHVNVVFPKLGRVYEVRTQINIITLERYLLILKH